MTEAHVITRAALQDDALSRMMAASAPKIRLLTDDERAASLDATLAFRVPEPLIQEELSLLWRREMLSGSYQPRWVRVRGADGVPFGHAVAFTIHRGGENYAGGLTEAEVVRSLATASGALGSAADYLFRTADGLRSLGIADPRIERLVRQVRNAAPSTDAPAVST